MNSAIDRRDVHTPVVNRTRIVLLGGVVPTIAIGATMILVLSWQSQLPDRIATHWNATGRPDQFSSLSTALVYSWLMCGFVVLFNWLLVAFAALRGFMSSTRRMCVATSWFLTGLIIAVTVGQYAGQRDGGLSDGTAIVLVGLLGALILAVVGWLLIPGDKPAPARRPEPRPGQRVVWVSRTSNLLPLAIVGVIGIGLLLFLLLSRTQLALLLVVALVFGVLAIAGIVFSEFTVTVDRSGLSIRGGLRLKVRQVPLADVVRAEVVQVRPIAEFGGWGVRVDRHGRMGIITHAGQGLQVTATNERVLVVTVPDAGRGAGLLNALADR